MNFFTVLSFMVNIEFLKIGNIFHPSHLQDTNPSLERDCLPRPKVAAKNIVFI
jgi:hypothetical protein